MSETALIRWLVPPKDYVWFWDEEANPVWRDDGTVAVAEELFGLVEHLAADGLPPLGAMLMVLMACRGRTAAVRRGVLRCVEEMAGDTSAPNRRLVGEAMELLETVSALPEGLRTGVAARGELLRTLFRGSVGRMEVEVSEHVVAEVRARGWGWLSFEVARDIVPLRMMRDLRALKGAAETVGLGLETRLRTGVAADVGAAVLPEVPESGRDGRTLLERLAESGDAEVEAVAAVVRQMVAMLSVARVEGQPGGLPVGGVSGIAVRGPLDRLLLSELAADDLVLAARLASGEALYLERDTPPQWPPMRRVILLDGGIRLWGVVRVLAMAAALGLAVSAPKGHAVGVRQRRGRRFEEVDLTTVEGVRDCLAVLEPGLATAAALGAFEVDADGGLPDVFLVTVDPLGDRVREALYAMSGRVSAAGGRLFVIGLTRSGKVELTRRSVSGAVVVATGRIDPEVILGVKRRHEAARVVVELTDLTAVAASLAFYRERPLPMRFPCRVREGSDVVRIGEGAVVAVGENGRLMRWDAGMGGALEVAARRLVKAQRYVVLREGDGYVVVCHGTGAGAVALRVDGLGGERVVRMALRDEDPVSLRVSNGAVVSRSAGMVEAVSLADGRTLCERPVADDGLGGEYGYDGSGLVWLGEVEGDVMGDVRDLVRGGLPGMMGAPISAGFDSAGGLVVRAGGARWQLVMPDLLWKETGKRLLAAARPFRPVRQRGDMEGSEPEFYVAEWVPECRLVFDVRGVLHVVMRDAEGAVEMAVFGVLESPGAAWVRDAVVAGCGNGEWLAGNGVAGSAETVGRMLRRFAEMAQMIR